MISEYKNINIRLLSFNFNSLNLEYLDHHFFPPLMAQYLSMIFPFLIVTFQHQHHAFPVISSVSTADVSIHHCLAITEMIAVITLMSKDVVSGLVAYLKNILMR